MKKNSNINLYKLVEDKIITYKEFFIGTQFPISIIDVVGFLNSELSIILKKSNKLKGSLRINIELIDKELSIINKTLYNKLKDKSFKDSIKFSDYFLDEVKDTIISDYKYLIKKGNTKEDSILLLMKRLCEISKEISDEFYSNLIGKIEGDIPRSDKSLDFIYSKVTSMISNKCNMINHKFLSLTNKIKYKIKIKDDTKSIKSSSLDLQKY